MNKFWGVLLIVFSHLFLPVFAFGGGSIVTLDKKDIETPEIEINSGTKNEHIPEIDLDKIKQIFSKAYLSTLFLCSSSNELYLTKSLSNPI